MSRAGGLRRDHRRRPAHRRPRSAAEANRRARASQGRLRLVSRSAPVRHTWVPHSRLPGWASNAPSPGSCGLEHVRETIPYHSKRCSTGCIRRSWRLLHVLGALAWAPVVGAPVLQLSKSDQDGPAVHASVMKIGLISLGCPKNLVDSEVMLCLDHDAGHELTDDPADTDVLVVNTCAFITTRPEAGGVDHDARSSARMAGRGKTGSGACRQLDRRRLSRRTLPRGVADRNPRDRRGARHR